MTKICEFVKVTTEEGQLQRWWCPECKVIRSATNAPKNRICQPDGIPNPVVRIQRTSNDLARDLSKPCIHRGAMIEERPCKTCQSGTGKPFVAVYSCELFQECTIRSTSISPAAKRPRSCATCQEYSAKKKESLV